MKLKKQPCKCNTAKYELNFKGLHFFFLNGMRCKQCGKTYNVKCLFENMSMKHIDSFIKIIFLLTALYYIILNFYIGAIYMVVLILALNYLLYPLLLKMGILLKADLK